MLFFSFIFITCFTVKAALPEIATKQAIENIRYISSDGRYTYYTQNSGDLLFSDRYENKILIKGKVGTSYSVQASEDETHILITKDELNHHHFSIQKSHEIYLSKMGDTELQFVAKGIDPQIYQDNTWISYFIPEKKEIIFQNLKIASQRHSIKINKNKNSFTSPEHYLVNPELFIYTEINNKGHTELKRYHTLTKDIEIIHTTQRPAAKIELCGFGNIIYIGEFSYYDARNSSAIFKISIEKNVITGPRTKIYESPQNDLGNILCSSDGIYFIKTLSEDLSKMEKDTEAALIPYGSKKLKVLTNLNHVQQLIAVGKRILIPYQNKVLVLKGESNLKKDRFENKSKPTESKEKK